MKDGDLIFGLMAAFDKEAYSFDDLRHLTAPFGVSEPSLRTSLSRMAAANLVRSTRTGRNARYRFVDKGLRIKSNISLSFTAPDWTAWDHAYWGVVFSVPEAYGENRHYIRKKLTKYRFACLTPGLWVRPLHPDERIPEVLGNILSSDFCRLIRFRNHVEFTAEQVSAMWNLGAVNRRFSEGLSLLIESEKILPSLSPQEALVAKMTVGDAVVNILFDDPLLPPQFLPAGWQGGAIRERFLRYDGLATRQSEPYWRKIYTKEDAL